MLIRSALINSSPVLSPVPSSNADHGEGIFTALQQNGFIHDVEPLGKGKVFSLNIQHTVHVVNKANALRKTVKNGRRPHEKL
jgi:hypothetical protein